MLRLIGRNAKKLCKQMKARQKIIIMSFLNIVNGGRNEVVIPIIAKSSSSINLCGWKGKRNKVINL